MSTSQTVLNHRAPKEGAILLSHAIPGLGQPGQWIEFDPTGAGVMNLTTGARLPMAMNRTGSPMQFGAPPSPADVHTPQVISNWLGAWKNKNFLLDTVVQQQMVDRSIFEWRNMNANDQFVVHDVRATMSSAIPQVQHGTETEEAKTEDLRVGAFVPYRTENEADYDFFMAQANTAANAIALWREYQAFASGGLFMTSGNWAAGVRIALGGTENWGPSGGGVASNPIAVLRAAVLASGTKEITYFVMNRKQAQWFLEHAAVVDYFKAYNVAGMNAGLLSMITEEQAGSMNKTEPTRIVVPGIGIILVHNAYATTDPATAPTPFWPDDIVLGFSHSATMPPNNDVCTAVTFVHKNPSNGTTGLPGNVGAGMPSNNGYRTRIIDMPLQGSGGRLIVIDRSEKTLFTTNNVGIYISGVS